MNGYDLDRRTVLQGSLGALGVMAGGGLAAPARAADTMVPLGAMSLKNYHQVMAKVLARTQYHHPVYTHASVAAQARRGEISGVARTWYAGAYWGFGFHEDGLRSGIDVARGLGAAHHALVGSVALKVIATSPVPVVVAR